MNLFFFDLAINGEESFNSDDFLSFRISDELVNQYTSVYWQELESCVINTLSVKEIAQMLEVLETDNEDLLKELEEDYIMGFPEIYPKTDFENLMNKDKCHYCNITLGQIESLAVKRKLFKKSLRGWSLEIDRLNSNLEYRPDNCVMSCYW